MGLRYTSFFSIHPSFDVMFRHQSFRNPIFKINSWAIFDIMFRHWSSAFFPRHQASTSVLRHQASTSVLGHFVLHPTIQYPENYQIDKELKDAQGGQRRELWWKAKSLGWWGSAVRLSIFDSQFSAIIPWFRFSTFGNIVSDPKFRFLPTQSSLSVLSLWQSVLDIGLWHSFLDISLWHSFFVINT